MSQYVSLHVKHNMELAHRLFTQPGKCQQIHGHGMQVELEIQAPMRDGYAINQYGDVLDFGAIKKAFRAIIDEKYDHKLHLNAKDPWASLLTVGERDEKGQFTTDSFADYLPGLRTHDGDPSTENFAMWIFNECMAVFEAPGGARIGKVTIWETGTNAVTYRGEFW